ncbi:MAG: DNA polymerase Y family protein [Hyphomicrobiales bacterium]|nr:DNA polymerase Y family protein [Hyphomicrobiales bacterium]
MRLGRSWRCAGQDRGPLDGSRTGSSKVCPPIEPGAVRPSRLASLAPQDEERGFALERLQQPPGDPGGHKLPHPEVRRRSLSLEGRKGALSASNPPLVVVAKVKSALRIVALDQTARARGLRNGQALADARAMVPDLDAVDEDPAADTALLGALADWAERYTPLVALDPPDGLMLDITGCAHLFDGEEALVADCLVRLQAQGFLARAAIADTPGAAWAVARFGDTSLVPPGDARSALIGLPLAALRLESVTVSALERVGLKRIGQIVEAPRAPLAARFGAGLINRLDQALGAAEEAISPRRPVAALIAERRFAEPIMHETDIAAVLTALATRLVPGLEARDAGARRFELALFRVDGVVARLGVGTSRPVRAPAHVVGLFAEKFAGLADDVDVGFGFDMVRLSVPETASDAPAQIDLAGDATGEADLAQLIDRIGARLGSDRVHRVVGRDSHIPERSEAFPLAGTLMEDSEVAMVSGDGPIDRPLRLFPNPEPVQAVAAVPDGPPVHFRWRRVLYRVARVEGPERIAPEWWRNDEDLTRDYFRVEDAAGHRFWLYREGLYGFETVSPRWYLHGVFG